uniref:Uncharacterized protein LOC114347168 n=1 Tax=Diabrotica virgifera virgifera TaxID=50390 RepID=A0A6P7H592_DIAVI
MVRTYKRKTHRVTPPLDVFWRAAEAVRNEEHIISIRKAAQDFGIHRSLARFIKRTPETNRTVQMGYKKSRLVFCEREEIELEKYLKKTSDMYFGLTPIEVRNSSYLLSL